MNGIISKLVDSLRPEEKRSAIISYRVTPRNKELLKSLAKDKGISVNGLMTEALIRYLENELKKG